MLAYLRPAAVLVLLLTGLTGLIYPLAVTGIAQALMPGQADGSRIVSDGRIIGSALVGQGFTSERYFHGRPSATTAPYDAASSSGSNLGPSSKALLAAVAERAAALGGGRQPADLVTASGSGLDPDISPEGALAQLGRVAAARGLAEDRLRRLVTEQTKGRELGLLGEPRVNVLALNLALDRLAP
jgi:K+-transporting ATPase ATPase C chain